MRTLETMFVAVMCIIAVLCTCAESLEAKQAAASVRQALEPVQEPRPQPVQEVLQLTLPLPLPPEGETRAIAVIPSPGPAAHDFQPNVNVVCGERKWADIEEFAIKSVKDMEDANYVGVRYEIDGDLGVVRSRERGSRPMYCESWLALKKDRAYVVTATWKDEEHREQVANLAKEIAGRIRDLN